MSILHCKVVGRGGQRNSRPSPPACQNVWVRRAAQGKFHIHVYRFRLPVERRHWSCLHRHTYTHTSYTQTKCPAGRKPDPSFCVCVLRLPNRSEGFPCPCEGEGGGEDSGGQAAEASRVVSRSEEKSISSSRQRQEMFGCTSSEAFSNRRLHRPFQQISFPVRSLGEVHWWPCPDERCLGKLLI